VGGDNLRDEVKVNKKYDKEDRKGDQGLTSCMGGLLEKTNHRVVLIGKLDTLTAKILTVSAHLEVYLKSEQFIRKAYAFDAKHLERKGRAIVTSIDKLRRQLYQIMAELSAKPTNIEEEAKGKTCIQNVVSECKCAEEWLNEYSKIAFSEWRYPSTTAACHMNEARTICRECEIMAWGATVHTKYPIYLNRLSDLLFLLTNVLSIIEE